MNQQANTYPQLVLNIMDWTSEDTHISNERRVEHEQGRAQSNKGDAAVDEGAHSHVINRSAASATNEDKSDGTSHESNNTPMNNLFLPTLIDLTTAGLH